MTDHFDPVAVAEQPLSEAEVQRLLALLRTQAVPAGGMTLEMVDGLISGLLVAPSNASAAEFLPLILGANPWADPACVDEVHRLLAKLWNHIGERIAIDPDAGAGTFMPLLAFPRALPEEPAAFARELSHFEFPLGAAWAGGFLHAVNLRLAEWGEWERGSPVVAAGLAQILRMVQLEADAEGREPPSAAERVAILAAMPYFLRSLAARKSAA